MFNSPKNAVTQHYEESILNISSFIQARFSNLVVTPVFNNLVRLSDTAMWPTENVATYGGKEIIDLSQHFEVLLENGKCDTTKILHEWKIWKLSHSYDYQQEIFGLSWDLKTYIYKSRSERWNVLHVFEMLLITTFTNTKVQRMFPRMARIKTDWRNCLVHDQLDSLLRISEESQSLGKFDPTPAIECWFNDKVLRLISSSQKYPEKRRTLEERTMVDIATLTMTVPWRWKTRLSKFWLNILYSWIQLLLQSNKKVKKKHFEITTLFFFWCTC